EAARGGGVNSIAVSWGWQSGALLQQHEPDHLFDAPVDMHKFFKALSD
ncbi:MAG TPA: carotenoid oxygenase, partial [Gammaproteobacteria bacterium]|nr:carotenoid oxygenase [Gammaproteobacteria bacterium]